VGEIKWEKRREFHLYPRDIRTSSCEKN
jgi:hypothetical protein